MEEPFPLPEDVESPRRGAPRPMADPPLLDQDPSTNDEDVAELVLFASQPIDDEIPVDERHRALEAVLGDGRVSELAGGGRLVSSEPAPISAKVAGEPEMLRFHLFSCETHRCVDVLIDRADLRVLDVALSTGQPAPTADEIDHAVALAAADLGFDAASDLEGRAIFVTRQDPSDPLFGHRLADVFFGKPDSRRPSLQVTVDVCEERVVSSGDFRRVDT